MSRSLEKIRSRYEASPLDDELVLIDVDTGKFFALKDVGLRIWHLLDDTADLSQIVDILCKEYDVAPDAAEQSVDRFADSLVDAGFAHFS